MSLEQYLSKQLKWSYADLTALQSEADSDGISPAMELYRRELSKEDILRILSEAYNREIADTEKLAVDKDITIRYGVQKCIDEHVLFGTYNNSIVAVIADPSDDELVDRIVTMNITNIMVAFRPAILAYETKYLKPLQVSNLSNTLHMQNESLAERINLTTSSDDGTIRNIVSYLVKMAFDAGASDIQLIPTISGKADVYFRIDGKRQHILEIDNSALLPLHRVLGSMAKQQTDDVKKIVQGKIDFDISDNQSLEVRLNIIPTRLGSSINLRLHISNNIDISAITNNKYMQSVLAEITKMSDGLILFCGPTGAGKSTTMAALTKELLKRDINICSVEDPVEQVIPGINQVDVNVAKGLTFATVTQSFLRHDPDVVIVGEIRDYEVANIVIQAADTGHLVLSTLHTRGAASAIGRLLNLGVERSALAENLSVVICQRLVRRICPHCHKTVHIKAKDLHLAGISLEQETIECVEAVGCQKCNNTGYSGRIAICEALVVTDELKYAIERGASSEEIENILKHMQFRTFLEDGFEQLLQKNTTLEELQPFITTNYLHGGIS